MVRSTWRDHIQCVDLTQAIIHSPALIETCETVFQQLELAHESNPSLAALGAEKPPAASHPLHRPITRQLGNKDAGESHCDRFIQSQ
jgi:hypothetical protein